MEIIVFLEAMAPLSSMDLIEIGSGPLTIILLLSQQIPPAKLFFDLIHKPSEEDAKIWPHRVALEPGGDLMLTSRIRTTNPDGKPFTFTFAYHTYIWKTGIWT